MTFAPSDPFGVPAALRPFPDAFPEETVGGGGTTSCVPKSLPMMLLTNDVLAGLGRRRNHGWRGGRGAAAF